ncbi:MAG: hypothetical protein A2X59_08210 [Nitrospirae bacterium GWC2_42_7]|nr:MAG: hypothetical protein A2X59_08210 [Nitrospirae bacterium GWC2_42_7]
MSKLKLVVVLFFLFVLSSIVSASVLLDRVVAVVNNEVITWSELYRAMEADASPQLKEMKDEDRRKIFKESEGEFLETLINQRLQIQEAKNQGIWAYEDEIKTTIENIKKKYSMTDAKFNESLEKEGFTPDEYRDRLRDEIIISKITGHLIRNKIVVTDEDIEKYTKENNVMPKSSESYRISQIFFKKPSTELEEKEVEEKASLVLNKIKNNENFSDLANSYSEDPSSAAGGDMGFIRKDHMTKEFVDVLQGMRQGETSKPFWTEKGLHIIKLDEKTEPKKMSETKEEVRENLKNKIFMERYNIWIKSLREKSFIEIRH